MRRTPRIEEYYSKEDIEDICIWYGQIYDNLTHNMRVMLIEKYEKEMKWIQKKGRRI